MEYFDRDLLSTAQAIDLAIERSIEDQKIRIFEEECRRLSTAFAPVVGSMTATDLRTVLIYALALRVFRGKASGAQQGGAGLLEEENEEELNERRDAVISQLAESLAKTVPAAETKPVARVLVWMKRALRWFGWNSRK